VSSSNPPPAEGVRVHWEQLPTFIRREIEERLGEHVVRSITQPGGFSPGMAARLTTAGGREVFVKEVSERANPDTPQMHRREAEVVAALPCAAWNALTVGIPGGGGRREVRPRFDGLENERAGTRP
jgi:hypothetical protein